MRYKLEEFVNKHPLVKDFAAGVGWSLLWDVIYSENGGMTVANTLPDTAMLSAFCIGYGIMYKEPAGTIAKKTGAFAAGTVVGQGIYHGVKYLANL